MKYTEAYTPPTVQLVELSTESTMTTLSFNDDNNTEFFGFDPEFDL